MLLITNLFINNTFSLTWHVIKATGYIIYYGGSFLYNNRYYKNQEKQLNTLHIEIIELNKIITELKEESDTEFVIVENP